MSSRRQVVAVDLLKHRVTVIWSTSNQAVLSVEETDHKMSVTPYVSILAEMALDFPGILLVDFFGAFFLGIRAKIQNSGSVGINAHPVRIFYVL